MAARIENNMLVLKEQTIAPATPTSGDGLIYPLASTSLFHQITDGAVDRSLAFSIIAADKDAVSISGVTGVKGFRRFAENLTDGDVMLHYVPWFTNRRFLMYDPSLIPGASPGTSDMIGGSVRTVWSANSLNTNADGDARQFDSGTTPATNAGILNSATSGNRTVWLDSACELMFYAKVKTPATMTFLAFCVGMGSAEIINDDITTDQGVYFRYSTSASDPGWVGVVHASAANRTVTGSLASIAPSTTYELLFYLSSDGVRFSVDGAEPTLVAYPSGWGSTPFGTQVTVQSKENVNKSLEVYTVYWECK